jgi:autophagy-related protein 2
MIIDDAEKIGWNNDVHNRRTNNAQSGQVQKLSNMGYVPVCYISSAVATLKVMQLEVGGEKSLDVELRDDLLILETCADSTQTLVAILNGLTPPTPPNTSLKYRTEVVPIQDMLVSFSGDAFATDPLSPSGNLSDPVNIEHIGDDPAEELEYISDFYPSVPDYGQEKLSSRVGYAEGRSSNLLDSFHSDTQVSSSISGLDFQDDHFAKKSAVGGTAHRWDSAHNTYGLANDVKLHDSPLRVRIRDVHVIWNLFDGYDWQRTRDTISKAVKNIQAKATERRAFSPGLEDDEESVIGDFLFNSIYIGIPSNRDPRELSHDINRNIDDLASETGSYVTSSTVTVTSSRTTQSPTVNGKRLRLGRSKHHKMTFELKGISADLVVFPPGSGETQSSLDIRIADLEIFDHVPTSTWKKFATYMHDAGERETGTSMVHLEILNVKPVAELAASEIVLKVGIFLPFLLQQPSPSPFPAFFGWSLGADLQF